MKTLVILIAAAALLILIALAWQGRYAPGPGTESDPDAELRIEIRESAGQAEQHYRQIRERFANDPDALTWVDTCVADAPVPNDPDEAARLADTWTRACWAAYAQRHD